jgi:hypothetical protein
LITSIRASDGSEIFNHDNKAAFISNSFKDRLGVSSDPIPFHNLINIVQAHDLSQLDLPFSLEEIEEVVKDMPADRSPGPDGFNGAFLKKCWQLVKEDFIKLIQDFYDENLNLKSINTAHITLILKKVIIRT